jgi:hypothetical protein
MSFEVALSWVAVLAGGLSPILVSFVALVIGHSRRRKGYYWTLANRWNRADRGTGLTLLRASHQQAFMVSCTAPFDGGSEISSLGGRGSWTGSGFTSRG